MNKKIYYYNRKYPEFDIKEIIVNDEELLVRKDWQSLNGIISNYDICCMKPSEEEYFISLYSPYEDKEIYIHDTTIGNELAFSYNKKLLQQWRNEDIEYTIHKLTKRIKALKEGK
jgi:uncharacterized lipoprotein YddW (UPF0748 family)